MKRIPLAVYRDTSLKTMEYLRSAYSQRQKITRLGHYSDFKFCFRMVFDRDGGWPYVRQALRSLFYIIFPKKAWKHYSRRENG